MFNEWMNDGILVCPRLVKGVIKKDLKKRGGWGKEEEPQWGACKH